MLTENGSLQLQDFTDRNFQEASTQVTEGVWHVSGLGHSNAVVMEGNTGVILIDTLDTLERNGETFTAGITQIGQSVDSRTGLFEIKAATENTQLSNGVTVKITADTYRTNDALLLPYDAVYYEAEQAYVYCCLLYTSRCV